MNRSNNYLTVNTSECSEKFTMDFTMALECRNVFSTFLVRVSDDYETATTHFGLLCQPYTC